MEKLKAYLIIAIILCITILGVAGEYFTYKYYALTAAQRTSQTTPASNTGANNSSSNSSDASIASFTFAQLNPIANGVIDETNHTINVIVPYGTDVTSLVPTIEVSENATVSPLSNSPQDFTNPVTYTVTAQDGSVQQYTVTVNLSSVTKSTVKTITSFTLSGFNPEVDGTIDNQDHTIYVVVPDDTDLTNLTPIIELSAGATVSPNSGVAQDFTNPTTYTVTAQNGTTQNYTVTVVTESNSG